jgi:hypothetical protein
MTKWDAIAGDATTTGYKPMDLSEKCDASVTYHQRTACAFPLSIHSYSVWIRGVAHRVLDLTIPEAPYLANIKCNFTH